LLRCFIQIPTLKKLQIYNVARIFEKLQLARFNFSFLSEYLILVAIPEFVNFYEFEAMEVNKHHCYSFEY